MFIRVWLKTNTIRHITIKLRRHVLLMFGVSHYKGKLFWDLFISLILNMKFFYSIKTWFYFFKLLRNISLFMWIIRGIIMRSQPRSKRWLTLIHCETNSFDRVSCFFDLFFCVNQAGWSFCHWYFAANHSFSVWNSKGKN